MLSEPVTLFPCAVHIFKKFAWQGGGERVRMGNASVEEHFGKIPHFLKAGSFGEEKATIRKD